jgi:hypothetical protein
MRKSATSSEASFISPIRITQPDCTGIGGDELLEARNPR